MAQIKSIEDRPIPGLKNNPKIWIAVGESRFDTDWKNKKVSWGSLLGRFKNATMTQETQEEYRKLPKNKQDTIKDVGGFVGGTLKDGHRKSGTVLNRSLLTFDLDYAPKDFVETMILEAPYAWAIYSTHKHKPDAPRYRLIAPLSRDVSPEEYEAIARKVAEGIGVKYFDSTTCQPSRLMYWPSYSRDAEYVFEYNDGPALDADEVLAEYPDWKDVSFWPLFPDEEKVQKRRLDKQQDPTKKDSLVGVFCRTYDVPSAIETFLSDVYARDGDKTDRYSYLPGTTSGGLVIYDGGLFCYSNHSTDPAHGMDLNAFDLVRVHKFGELDDEVKPNTPTNRMPSYKEMIELVRRDSACLRTYDAERRVSALEDFEGEDAAADDWMLKLSRAKNGEVEGTRANLRVIFGQDDKLNGMRMNFLYGTVELSGREPWAKEARLWQEDDESYLASYLARVYTEKFKKTDTWDELVTAAAARGYDPLVSYIEELPAWDGIQRAESLFIDYLGAEDCDYVRSATRVWLMAAIKRIREPGCKFDNMIILTGAGGIGKSTILGRLGGEWFNDSLKLGDMKDKTAAEKVRLAWICEIQEMSGRRRADLEAVKAFLSTKEDIYRGAYARKVSAHKRRCVFAGTANESGVLMDVTGNRRFWPISCAGGGRLKAWRMKKTDVEQIWAEVKEWIAEEELLGEVELILPPEVEAEAKRRQLEALDVDEDDALRVKDYLEKLLPEEWRYMDTEERRDWLDDLTKDGTEPREIVCVAEIWTECFGRRLKDKRRQDSFDIARILQRLGWVVCGPERFPIFGVQKAFRRGRHKAVTKM